MSLFTLALFQQGIDLRYHQRQTLRTAADGLVPVVDGHVVLLLLRLVGSPCGIGISTVGEELYDAVQLVHRIRLAP